MRLAVASVYTGVAVRGAFGHHTGRVPLHETTLACLQSQYNRSTNRCSAQSGSEDQGRLAWLLFDGACIGLLWHREVPLSVLPNTVHGTEAWSFSGSVPEFVRRVEQRRF